MQEKSGQTRCKKKRVPKLSQEQFATFDEANSIQSKLAVAERLLAELVNGSTAAHRTTTVRRDVVRQLIAFHRETMSANGSPKNV